VQKKPLEILHIDYGEIIDMNADKKQITETLQQPLPKEKKTPFFFSFFSFFKKHNR